MNVTSYLVSNTTVYYFMCKSSVCLHVYNSIKSRLCDIWKYQVKKFEMYEFKWNLFVPPGPSTSATNVNPYHTHTHTHNFYSCTESQGRLHCNTSCIAIRDIPHPWFGRIQNFWMDRQKVGKRVFVKFGENLYYIQKRIHI